MCLYAYGRIVGLLGLVFIKAEYHPDDTLPVCYHLHDKSHYNLAMRNAIWEVFDFKDRQEICVLCQMFDFGSTVNLCSKGPGRVGNPSLRDIDFSPDTIFFSYSEPSVECISGDRLFLCLIGKMPYSHFSYVKKK